MTTKKNNSDVVVVPLRVDVPVGSFFKFQGKRTVYEVVAAPTGLISCDQCVLRDRRHRLLCASLLCFPALRQDKAFVYVKKR